MDGRIPARAPLFPDLGVGVGLRPPHFARLLEGPVSPHVRWLEALTENYFAEGGRPRRVLFRLRERYPVVLHGVSLSIGSTDPLSEEYLTRLRQLADEVDPSWVSDHCCWTGVNGENLHDLLPLPFTEETLRHLVPRVAHVQERLGRRILLENVSSYLTFSHSEMSEWEFLAELSRRADCGLLVDVNNIYVSSVNHRFDPLAFLAGIPRERVGQFHLAGHQDCGTHLLDTHDHPVCEPVWKLYAEAVRLFGRVSTLVERDDRIPPFATLEREARRAGEIRGRVLSAGKEKRANRPLAPRAAAVAPLDLH
jgi:uncharacterized protein (UPF0276 family)